MADSYITQAIANLAIRKQMAANDRALPFPDWAYAHFGAKLWAHQVDFAEAVFRYKQVAWRGCHGIGKSFTTARFILRWLQSSPDAVVLLTGARFDTVLDTIFSECRKAIASDKPGVWPTPMHSEIRFSDDNYVRVFTTDKGNRIQGYHGKVLIVVDEAQEMLSDLMPSIRGIQAGGDVHIVLLGNPTVPNGAFYDAFAGASDEWVTFTTSAFDTPNLLGYTIDDILAMDEEELYADPYPELITRSWVRDRFREWGPDSPLYISRVLGRFPEQASDALLSLGWLESARARRVRDAGTENVVCGLDVAYEGDNETVLVSRSGPAVLSTNAWTQSDPLAEVMAALDTWGPRLERVVVDGDGVGYHFASRLRDAGYPVVTVRGNSPAHDKDHYVNRKAEMWFGLRRVFFANEIANVDDAVMFRQLNKIKYKTRNGKLAIESKAELKARGVESPDRADALCYAFANATAERMSDDELASAKPAARPAYLSPSTGRGRVFRPKYLGRGR